MVRRKKLKLVFKWMESGLNRKLVFQINFEFYKYLYYKYFCYFFQEIIDDNFNVDNYANFWKSTAKNSWKLICWKLWEYFFLWLWNFYLIIWICVLLKCHMLSVKCKASCQSSFFFFLFFKDSVYIYFKLFNFY